MGGRSNQWPLCVSVRPYVCNYNRVVNFIMADEGMSWTINALLVISPSWGSKLILPGSQQQW